MDPLFSVIVLPLTLVSCEPSGCRDWIWAGPLAVLLMGF
jgi:hypothetical protein